MSDNTGRIIFEGLDKAERGGWDEAPAEAIVENVRRGDIEAWNAMLKAVGMTEEDFVKQVADDTVQILQEENTETDSSGTVE